MTLISNQGNKLFEEFILVFFVELSEINSQLSQKIFYFNRNTLDTLVNAPLNASEVQSTDYEWSFTFMRMRSDYINALVKQI